jgi:hypothetical protein
MGIELILAVISIVSTAIAVWSKLDARLDHLGERLTDVECFLEKGDFRRRNRRD